MMRDKGRIKAAAIKSRCGEIVYTLPPPNRHHNIIKYMAEHGEPVPITGEQGFITEDGKFVRRRRAKMIARLAGQLLERADDSPLLFSEDVW